MKKVGLFFILFAFLCSSTEFVELLKMPILVQHFKEHKALEPEITFNNFIFDHYWSDVPHTDNDEDRDRQLPFNDGQHCTSHSLSIFTNCSLKATRVAQPHTGFAINRKFKISNDFDFSAGATNNIWQPPKSV